MNTRKSIPRHELFLSKKYKCILRIPVTNVAETLNPCLVPVSPEDKVSPM